MFVPKNRNEGFWINLKILIINYNNNDSNY